MIEVAGRHRIQPWRSMRTHPITQATCVSRRTKPPWIRPYKTHGPRPQKIGIDRAGEIWCGTNRQARTTARTANASSRRMRRSIEGAGAATGGCAAQLISSSPATASAGSSAVAAVRPASEPSRRDQFCRERPPAKVNVRCDDGGTVVPNGVRGTGGSLPETTPPTRAARCRRPIRSKPQGGERSTGCGEPEHRPETGCDGGGAVSVTPRFGSWCDPDQRASESGARRSAWCVE